MAKTVAGDILSIKQLADYLMVSERTIYRMLDRNLLPAIRIGSQWRFRKRDIDAWLDEQVHKVEVGGQKAVLPELETSEIEIHPLLSPSNVWLHLAPQPRDALLTFMIASATLEEGVDRGALLESIREREVVCSTALVSDAAFPHPNDPSSFRFSRKRVLLATTREPIDFQDPHGHRPSVVAVVLARTVQGYLHTISRAVKLFGDPALITLLSRARRASEAIDSIREAEERLRAAVAR